MTDMIILGPPGAGKGTQAALIAERLSIPTISTGDIFRKNVSEGTPLGLEAKKYMDRGEYVPDEVTDGLVKSRLAEGDTAGGFLLDGYPRTLVQVAALDEILASQGRGLEVAIELVVETDAVVARLLERATIENRADDTEDVIRRRMEVYEEQTRPLSEVYEGRGLLLRIDGLGTVEEVNDRILAALAAK